MFERDDRLFAEGDNVPLIFPKMKMNFDSDLVQRCLWRGPYATLLLMKLPMFSAISNA